MKDYITNLISLIFSLLMLTTILSCSYKSRNSILKSSYDSNHVDTVRTTGEMDNVESYYNLIAPEDALLVKYTQQKLLTDNSFTYRVNAEGDIDLPLSGKLHVGGLNRQQAAEKIKAIYITNGWKDPIVSVDIINLSVTLLGEIAKPGKFLISREDYHLIDLLGDAGGLLPTANTKFIKILRGNRAKPEIIMANLNNYESLKSKKLRLKSGDIVYVEPKRGAHNQNFQKYLGFIQLGILVINLLIINNR